MRSENTADVRAWAKQQGLKVSDRGRVPASLLDAYRASGTSAAPTPASEPTKKAAGKSTGKRRSSPQAKPTASVYKTQSTQPLTEDPDMFQDPQSVLRRLESLERQVSELGSRLESAAHALHPGDRARP